MGHRTRQHFSGLEMDRSGAKAFKTSRQECPAGWVLVYSLSAGILIVKSLPAPFFTYQLHKQVRMVTATSLNATQCNHQWRASRTAVHNARSHVSTCNNFSSMSWPHVSHSRCWNSSLLDAATASAFAAAALSGRELCSPKAPCSISKPPILCRSTQRGRPVSSPSHLGIILLLGDDDLSCGRPRPPAICLRLRPVKGLNCDFLSEKHSIPDESGDRTSYKKFT